MKTFIALLLSPAILYAGGMSTAKAGELVIIIVAFAGILLISMLIDLISVRIKQLIKRCYFKRRV